VNGKLPCPTSQHIFEYKYVLRFKEDNTHLIEFLGKHDNRRFNKYDRVFDMYDGIMLPPDEDSAKHGMFAHLANKIKKYLKGKYYDKEMLNKYEDETIMAMLNGVVSGGIQLGTVEACLVYLRNVQMGLSKVFKNVDQLLKVNY